MGAVTRAVASLLLLCGPALLGCERATEEHRVTDVARAQAEVLEIEHQTFEAIARKDAAALGRLLADDFTYRSPGNPDVRKPDFLRNVATIPVEIVSIEGEGLDVAVLGESVVVTGVQRATTRGADGAEITSRTAFTDVFVRRNGAWHLVLAYGIELPAS
jgi:ketosteroid isomerase-like protein